MLKVKFITIEELLEMKANNEKFKLVDVLEEEFKKGHIPGAVNIPLEKLPTLAKNHLNKMIRLLFTARDMYVKQVLKPQELF